MIFWIQYIISWRGRFSIIIIFFDFPSSLFFGCELHSHSYNYIYDQNFLMFWNYERFLNFLFKSGKFWATFCMFEWFHVVLARGFVDRNTYTSTCYTYVPLLNYVLVRVNDLPGKRLSWNASVKEMHLKGRISNCKTTSTATV